MAKYTSDTNLIRGAATAYRNYDNMPGMYDGLDKVTKAGTDMMNKAVKEYEAEQKKIEEEARKEQEKADRLNDDWNTLASGIYESAGSFMKDVEYKDTVASVKALRQEYIDAQNSKDAEKMAEVKIKFNNMNTEINAHKEFRALLTNPEYGMSDFVKGDNLEYMNGFINEDYVIGRNDKKEKTYTVNGVTKTMKEINEMVGVKDNVPYGKYGKLVNDYSKSKNKGNRNTLELAIRNGIVPDQTNPLRAFLNDKGFGNGQTFSDLLKTDVNRASIEKEIMNTFDGDNNGSISETEYENFVNAIVNPDNEFWKNNGGASAWKDQSRTIATELLANGAENAWTNNPANKPDPVVTDVSTGAINFYTDKVQKLNGANWDSGAATSVYNDIKTGSLFTAKDPSTGEINDYSYHFVNGKGGWYQNYQVGDDETTAESYVGPDGSDVGRIFTNDPRFRTVETKITIEEDSEGNITNSRGINIKTKTKKKYGSFKRGTQSIGLESILSSLQSFDKEIPLIQRQALIKFQEEVKNETNANRYKLVQHINNENNTMISVDQLDTMINDLVVDTKPKLK